MTELLSPDQEFEQKELLHTFYKKLAKGSKSIHSELSSAKDVKTEYTRQFINSCKTVENLMIRVEKTKLFDDSELMEALKSLVAYDTVAAIDIVEPKGLPNKIWLVVYTEELKVESQHEKNVTHEMGRYKIILEQDVKTGETEYYFYNMYYRFLRDNVPMNAVHVYRDGRQCKGNAASPWTKSLAAGDIETFFLQVIVFLENYTKNDSLAYALPYWPVRRPDGTLKAKDKRRITQPVIPWTNRKLDEQWYQMGMTDTQWEAWRQTL